MRLPWDRTHPPTDPGRGYAFKNKKAINIGKRCCYFPHTFPSMFCFAFWRFEAKLRYSHHRYSPDWVCRSDLGRICSDAEYSETHYPPSRPWMTPRPNKDPLVPRRVRWETPLRNTVQAPQRQQALLVKRCTETGQLIKMSRSGRGRGRGSLTFDIEAIGFARGEVLPEAVFKPPPLYPTTDFRAMPVKTGESEDYLLALKQELRGAMQRSPYFMSKKDEYEGFVPVERYSKKYLQISEEDQKWTPDWRRFPRELKPKKIIKKVGGKAKKPKPAASKVNVDVLKKIEELEKKGGDEKSDEEETEEEKNKKGEEEEEGEEPDEYDEEEHEEDNDYIASYFEDGDDYGVSSEDNMDEATY